MKRPWDVFLYLLFLVVLICAFFFLMAALTAVLAQEPDNGRKILRFDKFMGNDTRSKTYVDPSYSARAVNVDFQINGDNTIGKRRGFDSVGAFQGAEAITDIHAYSFDDGRSFLAAVGRMPIGGYKFGQIRITPSGSYAIPGSGTDITDGSWNAQGRTNFAVLNDLVFICNGRQRNLVYDGRVARPFPFPSPGQLLMAPSAAGTGSASKLATGEYRYVFRTFGFSGADTIKQSLATIKGGPVSTPIFVENGWVWINGWQYPASDSAHGTIDSIKVFTYRSYNAGSLDRADTFKLHPEIIKLTAASGNINFIDSIPQSSLLGSPPLMGGNDDALTGYNGNSGELTGRYGSLGYVKQVTVASGASSIYRGILAQPPGDTLGVVYWWTTLDTSTGIRSDTSRGYYVKENTNANYMDTITMRVPKFALGVTGMIKEVWRGHVMRLTREVVDTFYSDGTLKPANIILNSGFPFNTLIIKTRLVPDSQYVTPPYFLKQLINPADSQFSDGLGYDSLIQRGRFEQYPVPNFTQLLATENRLIATDGKLVYQSKLDSLQSWDLLSVNKFGANDNDQVTAIGRSRTNYRAYKNRSNFHLSPDFRTVQYTGAWGCIAPNSYVPAMGGHIYMASQGLVYEQEGDQLEGAVQAPVISQRLSNFELLPPAAVRSGQGFWNPVEQIYFFSVPDVDTNFVYFHRPGGCWATWKNLVFTDAVMYDTGSSNFAPANTMLFVKKNDHRLYRYGKTVYDAGVVPEMDYQTPLLFEDFDYQQPLGIGLKARGALASFDFVQAGYYGELGNLLSSSAATISGLANGYSLGEWQNDESRGFSLRIVAPFVGSTLSVGGIEAIEVHYRTTTRGF